MQTDVTINGDFIEGTLKHVTGYTGFSSDETEQSGNYLALKFDYGTGVATTVSLVGETTRTVTLDSDKNLVIRVTDDNKSDKIRIVASKGGNEAIKELDMTRLVLLSE